MPDGNGLYRIVWLRDRRTGERDNIALIFDHTLPPYHVRAFGQASRG